MLQQYVHIINSEADPFKAVAALGLGPNLQILSFIGNYVFTLPEHFSRIHKIIEKLSFFRVNFFIGIFNLIILLT